MLNNIHPRILPSKIKIIFLYSFILLSSINPAVPVYSGNLKCTTLSNPNANITEPTTPPIFINIAPPNAMQIPARILLINIL